MSPTSTDEEIVAMQAWSVVLVTEVRGDVDESVAYWAATTDRTGLRTLRSPLITLTDGDFDGLRGRELLHWLNAIACAQPQPKPDVTRFVVQRQVNEWFDVCAPPDVTPLRVAHYDYTQAHLCVDAAERLLNVMDAWGRP